MRTALILGLAATTALTVPAFAGDKNSGSAATVTCTGGTVALDGPTSLWPPNHKVVNEILVATSTKTGPGDTKLTVMVNSDEAADEIGSGHTPVDISVGEDSDESSSTATVPFTVLAERAGGGDGRTYTVTWTATFQDGSSCSSSTDTLTDAKKQPFLIEVPHDQGKGND